MIVQSQTVKPVSAPCPGLVGRHVFVSAWLLALAISRLIRLPLIAQTQEWAAVMIVVFKTVNLSREPKQVL